MAIHAPEVNFVTAAMTKTMPDSTPPGVGVEEQAAAPVRLVVVAPPMYDHAGLGEGEGETLPTA